MAQVNSLRGVTLATTSRDIQMRFYSELWGLTPVVYSSANSTRWLRARGSEPWVLGFTDAARNGLERLRLGAASNAAVIALHARALAAGCPVLTEPAPLEGPGAYFGFLLHDPDGRIVEISATEQHAARTDLDTPLPLRMSHVVLNSPDTRRTLAFYLDILGFQISDWYENDAIVFLRCNEDHHCLGIGQGSNTAINHMAFLVDDEAAVLAASERAKAAGVPQIWGAGRHGPGGNVFSYFRDPANFVCEYTAELIQIEPDQVWNAKEWKRTPQNANVWGTGGPTPEAIRLMSGEF
ncbi:MAG: VOC family protein [Polaromonas sp.]|uniref:VOC family protein n=1 Tax=Polaromonas sp. TaxID=1869339 RepID=UPI0025DC8C00|nr:VOC family protein [Polaromonas sp.]MBI2724765.1 VOC family protein [Polaromonas sp.]